MDGRLEKELAIRSGLEHSLKEYPDYVEEWYLNLKASDMTASTCRTYISIIGLMLKSIDNPIVLIDIKDITYAKVSKFYISIMTKSNGGETVETSDSYKQTIWYCLHNFFEFMCKRKYIESNPMELISKPKNNDLARINEHRILLTETDFKKILKSVKEGCGSNKARATQRKMKNRDMSIFLILMTTGLRKSALSEINISDIDFNTGILRIRDKGAIWHKYELTELTIAFIKAWMNDRKEIIKDDTDALFISARGKRIGAQTISDLVDKYCFEALGRHISPHKLRAGFCSIMYKKTGDIEKVRRMVGHSNVNTTQRYIVTGGDESKEAKEIMNKIFKIGDI